MNRALSHDRYLQEALLTQNNYEYLIGLYQQYKQQPDSVSLEWQQWFKSFPLDDTEGEKVPLWPTLAKHSALLDTSHNNEWEIRQWGHTLANLDPLGLEKATRLPFLQVTHELEKIYGQTIGLEFMHIEDLAERTWLQERFENRHINFSKAQQLAFFEQLQQTELLEQFLQTKFPGAKRFSIEGIDTLIPALDHSLSLITKNSTENIVIGMAHRGRLSVMAHILKKPLPLIFVDFHDHSQRDDFPTSGDVKYHQGYQSQRTINDRVLDLAILSNASHLESIVPIALGRTRFLQNRNFDSVLSILIHGDAAFSGQGIAAESLQLSQLPGYQVGGSLHVILNNQIGFTATPQEGRSTRYCSDIAKAIGCPILHVNADDVEIVVWAFELAIQYRYQFHKDIVIDLVGYRRHGHNEGDEPSYTQPLIYKAVAEKPTAASLYGQVLKDQNILTTEQEVTLKQNFSTILQKGLETRLPTPVIASLEKAWQSPKESAQLKEVPTLPSVSHDDKNGVDLTTLKKLGLKSLTIPEGFSINTKLERVLAKRRENIEKEDSIDWATAENLAFASLLNQGHPIRLVGQDTKRGTFSQRHAEWVDTETNISYAPLNNAGSFKCINSPLSEAAALGFEYGHSLALKGLTIWEAQFGDFVNGAQVIIDQYISAGYSKWQQSSNLVLLLPHGYEGQGPEHSSTRLERFLQLSAEENWRVAVCSTPANFFHLLKQQVHQAKPLIALTPKSLLRHPQAVSSWQHFSPDVNFKSIINDELVPSTHAEKIILCTGKVYYDLAAYRRQNQHTKTNIVRIEQLYPFPIHELSSLLKECSAKTWVWCQEEPQNMGAWSFVAPLLKTINHDFMYVGRPAAASPATGFDGRHKLEQERLLEEAFLL